MRLRGASGNRGCLLFRIAQPGVGDWRRSHYCGSMKTFYRATLLALIALPGVGSCLSAKEPLKEGDSIPSLSFGSDEGKTISLNDYRGRWLVLYFYPKDGTSGCTAQAKRFSELLQDYDQANATVFGINTDSAESHRQFKDKNELKVTLLTNPAGDAAALFGIRVVLGLCARDSVLINPMGKIQKIYRGVDPKGNPGEILEYIRSQAKG